MSSILKALKKLDPPPEDDARSWQKNTRDKGRGRNPRTKIRSSRKYSVLLGIVLVVFIGWLLADRHALFTDQETDEAPVNQGNGEKMTSYATARKKDGASTSVTPVAPAQPEELTGAKSPSAKLSHQAVSVQSQETAIRINPDLNTAGKSSIPATGSGRVESLKLSGKRKTLGNAFQADVKSSEEFKKESLPVLQGKPVSAAKKRATIKRLDSAVLRLQALTWATQIEDRFALIDNQIVRIGESIKGYSVAEIEEDFVVVQKEGRQWRLEFRLR